jgi:hypothetical protein
VLTGPLTSFAVIALGGRLLWWSPVISSTTANSAHG